MDDKFRSVEGRVPDVLKMKEDRSDVVLEIVLRGGSPWGMTLVGGEEYDRPLTIAEVGIGITVILSFVEINQYRFSDVSNLLIGDVSKG